MRFQELLENNKEQISIDDAVELIHNNQYAQEWIKESNNTPLYRGNVNLRSNKPKLGKMTREGFILAPTILRARTDRKPADSSRLIQHRYDQAAEALGYIKRAEAVFVTPTPMVAKTYGFVGVFFPLTPWEVNWSPTVKDFFSQAGNEDAPVHITDDIEHNKKFILDNYIKGQLQQAVYNELGEILVKCKEYILIPSEIYEEIKDTLSK